MRDRRFVAAHRGGPLLLANHRFLACWAADGAEAVLPLFTATCKDDRPQHALEIARAWANGEVKTGVAMRASVAAHAAAREAAAQPQACAATIAAARSSAQAVATAHFADHSMGALLYALKALEAAGQPVEGLWQQQMAALPAALYEAIESGILVRAKPLGIKALIRQNCP
jgi:hypothetical protein